MSARVEQHGAELMIRVPYPRLGYLRNIMRSESFSALWPLFSKAHDPLKEFTESYSALRHLKPFQSIPKRVLHIGDGAHCRTAALFAFFTKHENVAIDPAASPSVMEDWIATVDAQRVQYVRAKIEDYPLEKERGPVLVTFVHAHVDTDEVLGRLGDRWLAAYVCPCCQPRKQTSKAYRVLTNGADWSVLSPQRNFQVVVNEAALNAEPQS